MRRFRAYCLGLPKTGTGVIWHMFKEYASIQDAYSVELIDAIMEQDNDRIDRLLLRRDKLETEMDVSSLNGYVVENLVRLFPDSKFILTVRDCFGWVNHFWQHCLSTKDESWKLFWDWLFSNEKYDPKEEMLRDIGLYPIDSYVNHWVHYNKKVLSVVPLGRLMITKYLDINNEIPRISRFMDLSPHRLHKGFEESAVMLNQFLKIDYAHFTSKMRPMRDIQSNL